MSVIRKHIPKPLTLTKKQKQNLVKQNKNFIKSAKENPEAHKGVQEKSMGLGDVVEKFAQPIAKVIDSMAGTNIQGCGSCKKRKEYLNKKFPKI